MQNRKILVTQSGLNLLQVDVLDANKNVIRTSYEVIDTHEDVIGRFGSLKEAQNFIKMLSLLNEQDLEHKTPACKSE
jgi:hypothetical protein